jgi:hypothetical protein
MRCLFRRGGPQCTLRAPAHPKPPQRRRRAAQVWAALMAAGADRGIADQEGATAAELAPSGWGAAGGS